MAVSWVDPPNVPISRREPLDFIVTSNPVAISVKFPGLRSEERVWRDSAFQYPYLNSTVTGSGPYTFHLNRTGGWPADSTVYVDEGVAASVEWGLVYQVDFRTLANLSMPSPDTYTIDGLTWWNKAGGSGAAAHSIINGSGFYVGGSFAVNDNNATSYSRKSFLPFANVPGYNPNAPVVVQCTVNDTGNAWATMGLCDAGANANAFTAGEKLRSAALSSEAANPAVANSSLRVWKLGSSVASITSTPARTTATRGYGGYVVNSKQMSFHTFAAASFPNPYNGSLDTLDTSSVVGTNIATALDLNALGVYFSYNCQSGSPAASYVTSMAIWQAKT